MAVTEQFLAQDNSSESTHELSPLTPLRISSSRPVSGHPSRPKSVHTKSHRKRRIESEPTKTGPGFDFDLDIPTIRAEQTEEIDEAEPSALGKANRLAAVLLDSGKMIHSKFNVVDALGNTENGRPGTEKLKVSRAARNRTESVKAVLTLKYHWSQRSMETPPDGVAHAGVEGVYNPLQVIRNRAVRAKYHEPPPLAFRSLPLACNAFSSHNLHGKPGHRPWKLLWGVELNELVNDLLWRAAHWGELRNSKGELWFPQEAVKPAGEIDHNPTKRSRMHDALFIDKESDDLEDINMLLIPIESTRGSKVSLTKNLKRRLYGSSTGGALTSDSDSPEAAIADGNRNKSFESLSKVRIGRLIRRGSQVDEDADQNVIVELDDPAELKGISSHVEDAQKSQSSLHPPPVIVISNEDQGPEMPNSEEAKEISDGEETMPKMLQDVLFSPLHLRGNSYQADISADGSFVENGKEIGKEVSKDTEEAGPPAVDIEAQKIGDLGRELNYADKIILLNQNFLTGICPATIGAIKSDCDRILQEEFGLLFRALININESHLPAYENFYTGFANESKSLIHMANDNYAVQIDNLLSATDRSIGEINTSLSMDLRKVNEQLDKLNRSLFGSIVIEKLRSHDHSPFTNGSGYKTLYFVLENTIVIILWLVWIVVNIYKAFAFVVKILWRILTLLC